LALPGYALWQVATTCGNGFECAFQLPNPAVAAGA
jgi:hypothetical protein